MHFHSLLLSIMGHNEWGEKDPEDEQNHENTNSDMLKVCEVPKKQIWRLRPQTDMRKVCEGTQKNEYGGCAPKPICAKCVRVQKTKYGGCAPKPMCAKCVRVPKKTNMEAVTPNRGAKSV